MNHSMIVNILKNDLARHKFITFTSALFITLAALLVSLAAALTAHLSGAIDRLMTRAETPHYMQMQAGSYDSGALDRFVLQNDMIDEFQVLDFLNIDGTEITIGGHSFAGTTQDLGLSAQSRQFDYLLGLDGGIIQADRGELYVPAAYRKDPGIREGDQALICGKVFTVAGFLRDSQMNSMLSSSKRLLVNEQDLEELKSMGSMEYLIEFRLKDQSLIRTFESAYHAAGLPSNGPAVTYPLFRMINAISDGIMIGLILFVSLLVVLIALLCIRFTLLSRIEEDEREIGVMKAIGLRVKDIKKIYLTKYAVITAGGCAIGLLLSFIFRKPLLSDISLSMGPAGRQSPSLLLGGAGSSLVFFLVLLYVNGVLKRLQSISASQAMRGIAQETAAVKGLSLCRNRLLPIPVFLGVQDVLSQKKLYATHLAVLVFAVFLMIVPQNLYSTMSSESFVTYMGIGSCDLRFDIRQTDQMSTITANIGETLRLDQSIANYTVLTTKAFRCRTEDGSSENLQIELGDHNVFPVSYVRGRAPDRPDEIALSSINSRELKKTVGETLLLQTREGERPFTVCGIYSDITNGGKTAKADFSAPEEDAMWSIIYAQTSDPGAALEAAARYAARYTDVKVTDIQEYISQTYGQTLESIGLAALTAAAVACIIVAAVTLLFMKMLVTGERRSIAVLKACGFRVSDIQLQYLSRAVLILAAGTALGILLANTAGERLAGMVISSLGAASFRFTVNPLTSYLLCPLLMTCAVLAAVIPAAVGVAQIKIQETIKE